ncbi:cell division protein ZipA [Vreelandella utahensis]|uniref:cell division protein ZipA n=1 Tax=Vreelandella halophila TaxID=86177 RepID=UPI000985061A|nr:cell division protein ZipA [Halomonas utahensis]
MSLREWLIIIGALLIIGVVVDGLRRMRRARQDSLEIQRGMGGDGIGQTPIDDGYNPELPTGGARPVRGAGPDSGEEAAGAGAAEPQPASKPETGPEPEPERVPTLEPERAEGPDSASQQEPERPSDPEPQDEPLTAADDDGIVGPARVRGESVLRERAAEAGDAAGEAASRISAGAREIWSRIRDGVAPEEAESSGADSSASATTPQQETPEAGNAPEEPPVAGANRPEAEEVIVIHAHCRDDGHYTGATIKRILEACGMEYGDLGIYHRHEEADTRTPVQFSVASAVSPGTLTPEEIETLETPGLSFFMSLPGPSQPVQAFDFMLETANTVVRNLGGELRDEHRSVMTSQTIEHCRQRIREFERKRRSPARA